MSSTANSTVTAGDPHTIECNVTILIDYLVGEPAIVELSGPTGTILSRVTGLYLSHKLNSVSTSDTGLYTCRVIISVTSEGVLVTNVSTTELTVLPRGEPLLYTSDDCQDNPIILYQLHNIIVFVPLKASILIFTHVYHVHVCASSVCDSRQGILHTFY